MTESTGHTFFVLPNPEVLARMKYHIINNCDFTNEEREALFIRLGRFPTFGLAHSFLDTRSGEESKLPIDPVWDEFKSDNIEHTHCKYNQYIEALKEVLSNKQLVGRLETAITYTLDGKEKLKFYVENILHLQ